MEESPLKTNEIHKSAAAVACVVAVGLGGGLGHYLSQKYEARSAPQTKTTTAAAMATPKVAGDVKRYKIPVTSAQPIVGPADALITIVEWCDTPDPACNAIEPALQAARKRYPELVRLVYRHFGRPSQPGSALAHQFLAAAYTQFGKFWEARAVLMAHQGEITRADLERYAGQLGMDWNAIDKAIADHTYAPVVTTDRLFATMFNVEDSPAVFVNGRRVETLTQANLDQMIEEEFGNSVQLIAKGVAAEDIYAELTKKGVWTPLKREDLQAQPQIR